MFINNLYSIDRLLVNFKGNFFINCLKIINDYYFNFHALLASFAKIEFLPKREKITHSDNFTFLEGKFLCL